MISPVSGNNYVKENLSSTRSQQQNFSSLIQQAQSGQISAQTTSAVQLQGGQPAQHILDVGKLSHHAHWNHRMHIPFQTDADSGSTSSSTLAQLGRPVQATTASTAQLAYGNLQQDLQQVALNSDLLKAQASFLQDSALSVSA